MRTENYEVPPQQQNMFIALEMLKMFAILIHDDESDYSVNGLAIKKIRFPSLWFIVPIILRDMNLIAEWERNDFLLRASAIQGSAP